MSHITFKNLELNRKSISVRAEYQDSVDLWFEFDRDINVSSTQVALAMATLAGAEYDSIAFDFEVDSTAVESIRAATGASIEAVPSEQPRPITSSTGNLLSFSGGFDSLCAWRLMPEETHLVSMDFGGWFAREADFFKQFDTLIIRTNARSEPSHRTSLARNHWTFMAIGAILSAGYFNSHFHSFGQILGESLSRTPKRVPTPTVLAELGYVDAGYARGLTEVGTASVILQSDPWHVHNSLKSLSGPADRKIFRKIALSTLVGTKLGISVDIPASDPSKSPNIRMGDDYASSLAALYCISQGAENAISELFEYIPSSARDLASECSMDFMGKVNWDAYASFPRELREGLWENLYKFGFEPYSERDWEEIRQVRAYLAEAHKIAREKR